MESSWVVSLVIPDRRYGLIDGVISLSLDGYESQFTLEIERNHDIMFELGFRHPSDIMSFPYPVSFLTSE